MKTNKLVPVTLVGILALALVIPSAYAEYYMVCAPPAVEYVDASRPACHIKYYRGKHHAHHHRHHYYSPPKNVASVSVYYVWDMAPPMCSSCESTCGTSSCSLCSNHCDGGIYYVPASKAYMLDEYNGEFDFDRRTADDVGNDMDVDY